MYIIQRIEAETCCAICGATAISKYCDECSIVLRKKNYRKNDLLVEKRKMQKFLDMLQDINDGKCILCGSRDAEIYLKKKGFSEDIDVIVRNSAVLCSECSGKGRRNDWRKISHFSDTSL